MFVSIVLHFGYLFVKTIHISSIQSTLISLLLCIRLCALPRGQKQYPPGSLTVHVGFSLESLHLYD